MSPFFRVNYRWHSHQFCLCFRVKQVNYLTVLFVFLAWEKGILIPNVRHQDKEPPFVLAQISDKLYLFHDSKIFLSDCIFFSGSSSSNMTFSDVPWSLHCCWFGLSLRFIFQENRYISPSLTPVCQVTPSCQRWMFVLQTILWCAFMMTFKCLLLNENLTLLKAISWKIYLRSRPMQYTVFYKHD